MSASARLDAWEGRPIEEWRRRWRIPAVAAFAEAGSTNDIARALAEQGAPAGQLVMTEHQTAGRGRMRRPWSDSPGRSLLLSFVLRPEPVQPGAPGTAPVRVGIAIAAALHEAAGIDARIKWPNDVVVDGRKLAGILCEATSAGGETVIIAGVGINVLQRAEDWPKELRDHAVSIAQVAGPTAPGRSAVLDAVVAAMRPMFSRPLAPLDDDELDTFRLFDALRGVEVSVTGAGAGVTAGQADDARLPIRGLVAGIAPDGALLLAADGGMQRVATGTVRVAATSTHITTRTPR
ncbi:MAG TPA: biotin--[acetyl-CoA-carboxylase] ligase [Longimicrobiales bacterium]|nr:biotin--[acetyl-CoA-carboxylase] ligase [Longimicrobiales bacterium]